MVSYISKHSTAMFYELDHNDIVLVGGDWNTRIGNKADFIEVVNVIPVRHHIYTLTNACTIRKNMILEAFDFY